MNTALTNHSTDSLRQKVQEVARQHKASWIQLGQYLFTVYKDKLYKTWGFLAFETYCIKELGLKQTTATKLLKSYDFLEKEEPRLTAFKPEDEDAPKVIPNYESVNLLRLAKENQKFTPKEFSNLREAVLDQGKEPKEIKAHVKQLLASHDKPKTQEEKKIKSMTKVRRVVALLKGMKQDLENEDLVPDYLLKQIDALVSKLEDQLRD